jgi:hypothetical protein
MIPSGVAVIYLLAYIYPRDFTALAAFTSAGAYGLWLLMRFSQGNQQILMIAYILFAVALVISGLTIWLMKQKNGFVQIGEKKLVFMPPNVKYNFLVIAWAGMAVSLAAAILFGTTAAWIALIVMFGYLFVIAVYYTVKMI